MEQEGVNKGTIVKDNGVIETGTFINGQLCGIGIRQAPYAIYRGMFLNGAFNGYGMLETSWMVYVGYFQQGLFFGSGELITKRTKRYFRGIPDERGYILSYIEHAPPLQVVGKFTVDTPTVNKSTTPINSKV
jgi:hypothetical protein